MNRSSVIALALALAPLALSGCTDDHPRQAMASNVPAARVVGPPQNCVPLNQLHDSRIRDDSTIDFGSGPGNRGWRVTLPNRCPGLKSENRFTYETSLTQLCNNDIIYVLQDYGGRLQRGAGCGLGQFVPVEFKKK